MKRCYELHLPYFKQGDDLNMSLEAMEKDTKRRSKKRTAQAECLHCLRGSAH